MLNIRRFFGEEMAEKLKVLIVEDDPANLIVSVKSLERRNVEVLSARDAFEALDVYDNTENLSAVLTDIQLPGMDGTEMMRKMRVKEELTKISVPIFAMTAYAFEEDRKHFLEQGFDDVFIKPVDYDKIMETIQFYL
jgi:CheY-like chemotaxis protein